MITTSDNPYNPYVDYDKWEEWDREHGYNLPSYVSLIAYVYEKSNNLNEDDAWDLALKDVMENPIYDNLIYATKPA